MTHAQGGAIRVVLMRGHSVTLVSPIALIS